MARNIVIALLLVAGLGQASSVLAQQAGKSNTIRLDAITVEGELQKPQASYILQRSSRVSLSEDLKSKAPSYTARIQDTLKDDIFEARP